MRSKLKIRSAARGAMTKYRVASAVLAAVWVLALAVGTGIRLWQSPDASSQVADAAAGAAAQGAGWGSEVLVAVREQAFELSPFAVANACGIGASSCFKCHNGARASAPKTDKATHPWHADHKTVNDSCVGCHSGNARLIKKELSHEKLINDPRSSADRCASCHKSGDAAALVKTYAAIAAGGKKP